MIAKAESGFSLTHLAEPMYSVAVSMVIGILYGIAIGRIMATPARSFNIILRHLPQGLGNRWAFRPLYCHAQRRYRHITQACHLACSPAGMKQEGGSFNKAFFGVCRTKGVVRTSVLAVLAVSIFWSAEYLRAEPLLACVLSGIITINRKCAT